MSKLPNNPIQKQPKNNSNENDNDNKKMVEAAFVLLNIAWKYTFNNPLILNLLKKTPVIGNILFLVIIPITTASFVKDESETIEKYKYSRCENSKRYVASELRIDTSDILETALENTEKKTANGNELFYCKYTRKKPEPETDSKTYKYRMEYLATNEELISSIKEKKITEEVLDDICKNRDIYTEKLKQKYNPNTDEIKEIKLDLLNDETNSSYPVFRWKCMYSIQPKNEVNLIKPGVRNPKIPVGLDLDKYCEDNFKNEGLIKARYHYYNDPNSLHCVNPNF